jgi:Tol biopolymer transport system component
MSLMDRTILPLALLATALGVTAQAEPATDPLAAWRSGVRVRRVSPEAQRHTIHSYFNTCPESPDGKHVLFFASSTPEAHLGDVCVRDRATGEEKVLARKVHVEDAHRAACQQWVSGGRRVVYQGQRGDGQWYVASVNVDSAQNEAIVFGRLAGWGQPHANLVPLYGPHWDPGPHRNLELLDVNTGQIRTVVNIENVKVDWLAKVIGDKPASIFFPVLSPDLSRVFFKMATPAGGDARSKSASTRLGLVCYSLAEQRFLYDNPRWGHPSWHPDSRTIVEMNYQLFDSDNGTSRQIASLPSPRGDHPSASPDGRLIVTDTTLDVFGGDKGQWAIIVADARGGDYVVLHKFDNSRGASSWRRSHPHPVFSLDGSRIYFNTSSGDWTQLHVTESASPAAR